MTQLFKGLDFQSLLQKRDHAVVRGKAVARERPAREGCEANFVGEFFQIRDGESAAIRGTHDCAYAGARNHANRDAFFFEDFENPNVRDAASKASAQGDANGGNALRYIPIRPAGKSAAEGLHRPDNPAQTRHWNPTFPVCRGRKPYTYDM